MRVIAVLATLVSAGALVVSGAMKLGRSRPVRQAMRELDVPLTLQRSSVAACVPVVELVAAVGALTLDGAYRTACAVAVLALHLVFVVVVWRVVRAERPADCHCFGTLSRNPVSRRTLLRNVGFAAAALVGLALGVAGDDRSVVRALAAAVVVAAVTMRGWSELRTWRSRPRPEQLFLQDPHGARLSLVDLQQPATVLVFFSAGCRTCHDLVPYFRWWPTRLPDGLDLQPVLRGTPEEFAQHAVFAELVEHAWYDDGDVAAAVGVPASPGAAYISTRHPLGDGGVFGRHAIEDLLRRHGADLTAAPLPGSD
ncbi:MauE/DoxX family redox-associated membrane protein [Luteipulveratus halotolerans]|uniref:MauE/DoxX family redox-associated membrane protein n=1 Tax=Luteipulveratus halotolerans TaxID=1631356 RepID=UPI0006811FF7|nr:MauE/DoxX family redox-associated membrane protein [Luteipulveratus halotolerans]